MCFSSRHGVFAGIEIEKRELKKVKPCFILHYLYCIRDSENGKEGHMKKNNNIIIICKATKHGKQNFFLLNGMDEYFLFNEDFKKGVHDYYFRGVRLDDANNFSKCKRNTALMKTMSKIPMYVKYLEREHGLEIFETTRRRNRGFNNRRRRKVY